jgi:hypothetical protein
VPRKTQRLHTGAPAEEMSIYEGVPVGPDACPAPGRAVEAGLVGRPSIRVLGQSMFETELDSVRSSSRWKEFKKILPQLMMIAAILALPVCVVFKHPLQRALAGEKESDAGPPIQPSSPRQNASTSTISSSDNYPMAYGLTTFLQPPGSAVYLPMRDQSIATVLSLPSDYVVSFSLFVADGGYQPEFSSIVQLSTTELRGRLPFPYAQRARESNVPGISFMHKSRRLVVRVDPQHQYNPQMMNSWCVLDQHIPVGHTANVEVRLGEGHVVVRLNGVVATEQGGQCMRQRALTQHPPIRPVYVYAPDPRIPAARAVISNLTITRTQPVAGCLSSRACNRVWEAVQPDKAQPCIFPTYSLDKPSVDCTGRFPMSGINSSATTWWFLRNQPTQLSRAPSIVFDEGAEGKSAGLHAVIDLPVDFRLEFTVIPHEIQYLGTMPVLSIS